MKALVIAALVLLFGALSSLSCGSKQSMVVGPGEAPCPPTVILHGDVEFTTPERNAILDAASLWRLQTDGLAMISVVWDLDFNDLAGLTAHRNAEHAVLVRMESDMDLVRRLEGDDGSLLGWVAPLGGIHNPWGASPVVHIVADRLPTRHLWVQTVTHEFGHLLGLPHLPHAGALMYPVAIPSKPACLTRVDLSSFCQVHNCGQHVMHPCGETR